MVIKMKTQSPHSTIYLVPPISTLLIMVYQVLGVATTPPTPDGQPLRYILYWFMLILAELSANILPLWIGYRSTHKKYSIKLGKLLTSYFLIYLIGMVCTLVIFHTINGKHLFSLFFPFSHNNFQFGFSVLILLILARPLSDFIKKLTSIQQLWLAALMSWMVIVAPMIFKQNIWGISTPTTLIWCIFLFLIGSIIQNNKSSLKHLPIHISLTVICLASLLFLLKIRPISDTTLPLNSRLFSSYSLIPFLISVGVLLILIKIENRFTVNRQVNTVLISLSIVGYIFTKLPSTLDVLSSSIHVSINVSSLHWLSQIILIVVGLMLATIILAIGIHLIEKIHKVQQINQLATVSSLSDILTLCSNLPKIVLKPWRFISVFTTSILIVLIQFISAYAADTKLSLSIIKTLMQQSFSQILLTVIILLIFYALLFSIFNRIWISFTIFIALQLFIAVAEYLKLKLRSEPILPTDLSMLSAVGDLSKMISPLLILIVCLVIIGIIALGFFFQHKDSGPRWSLPKRVIIALSSLIFFSGSLFVNHNNSIPKAIFDGFNVQWFFYDQTSGAEINGPIVQFISNLDSQIMEKPSDYSKANITKIMKKYDREAVVINKTRSNTLKGHSVIFILSESFSNPNRVPNLSVKSNPIPYLLSLKKKTTSGLMLSSGYGGGTANMEWEALTGLDLSLLSPTLPIPYTQLVPRQNIAPAFTNLFDQTVAIHPYNASLYNRKNVFKKFGFQKFYYQGSKYKLSYQSKIGKNPYVSDSSAYKQTLKLISDNKKKSQFIQLSTMQNHMPFDKYYSNSNKYKVTGSGASDKQSIENYSQGLNYTDKALKKFITSLNKNKRNITVVWYGDHLAALYDGDSMQKYGVQLHETDYFIYNNKSRKIIDIPQNVVSPYEFPAMALSVANAKLTPYYALLTQVQEHLPAMITNPATVGGHVFGGSTDFINSNNKIIKKSKLTSSQKKLVHDYTLIQYDLTAGKQYSAKWATQKH